MIPQHTMASTSHLPLFGGVRYVIKAFLASKELLLIFVRCRAWAQDEWTSSDDRVRGGSSKSALDASSESLVAKFEGNLDITTLGGAGFASQRTVTEEHKWDLSDYDGIDLSVDHADGKLYTLTLKDEILPKRPDGREQSTLSWEFDFRAQRATTFFIKWSDFRPTYRGKDQKYVEPLDLKNIRRFGIMIRRYVAKRILLWTSCSC